ncbi:hypothetical protein SAY87_000294 [Trapa incisa]|uniref:SUMO-activating enzyme subunit n=1 Tax=Trapa incisa TaxID=236973 RepID=A0AAN7GM16_9MYRT|nr:hypothetical protein SAY87_000294 [Trapa incisa]
MAPKQLSSAKELIRRAKVLMVGAGGIGCELLKTLALSGFEDIHIIDMDTIEVSNLNRQFLFRQSHVGQSKAKVARDAVLRFRPNINITPHHDNVKDPHFNVDFFKQFSVVLNGLDNLDARRHVNRLCLAAEVPLVESGTTGFLGQVTVHVKGKTECYECQPKPAPKKYPVCTITSTPSKFIHCIVWAKELLFAKLFGDKTQDNDLNVHSSDTSSSSENLEDVFERKKDEDIEDYGRRIFDHVFGYNIEMALSNEDTWKNRDRPRPIYSKDTLPGKSIKHNGNISKNGSTDDTPSLSAMTSLGMRSPQDVWSLMENSKVFIEALKLFFTRREKDIGSLTFDKDDQLAVEFVTAAANIRASSFGIPLHSLFEAKGMAGNIVHAVATTNAVIAGLIVIEAIKVLQNETENYRMTYCLEYPNRNMLLMPVEPYEPNKSCYVCSKTPLSLEINTHRSKLRDFVEKIVKAKLGMHSPIIMHGSALLYEVGDDLEEDMVVNYAANLEKVLYELPSQVSGGTTLTVEDMQQELVCSVNIKHRDEFDEEKEPDGMVLEGWSQPPPEEKKEANHTVSNAGTSISGGPVSKSSEVVEIITVEEELEAAPPKKRKLTTIIDQGAASPGGYSSIPNDTDNRGKVQVVDDDDEEDMVMLDGAPGVFDGDSDTSKKRKLV